VQGAPVVNGSHTLEEARPRKRCSFATGGPAGNLAGKPAREAVQSMAV